jgi:hypothetical protein
MFWDKDVENKIMEENIGEIFQKPMAHKFGSQLNYPYLSSKVPMIYNNVLT